MNVFIFGAGFTKAVFADAPLNRELLKALAAAQPSSVATYLSNRYQTRDIEIALTRLDIEISSSNENSGCDIQAKRT